MRTIIFAVAFLSTSFVSAEPIGTVDTTGLFIKDQITVEAFDDPTIKGVSCYTTVHSRALPWSEGSASVSLSCRKIGPISGNLVSQANIFSRDKNIFFKKTVVDRFWDAKRRVLVYLTYTTDTGNKNKDHSLSVVPVDG